jgi:L-iditol 2-dehydrogenase
MPALVHYALQPGAVELRELPVPDINSGPGDDDVLLAVGAVSVCGSDIHQYHNTQSWPVNTPVVLGHEFCGTVAKTGRNVRGFKEGDRVVSETAASICGACVYCRAGEYNLCPKRKGFGYGIDGAMAGYVLVPSRCLHHIPAELDFSRAALTEPCCVAYNSVAVNSRLRPGDTVVVLGPGPIGLLCAQMARLNGSGTLIVAGMRQDALRLDAARALGATHSIAVEETDLGELLRSVGDGLGADLVIDASGSSPALKTALEIVRPGGQITKVGWGPRPIDFSLDPLVQKAITLQGSFSHTFRHWEKVVGMLASRQIDLEPVISRVSPLPGWNESFEGMHSGSLVKAVLNP